MPHEPEHLLRRARPWVAGWAALSAAALGWAALVLPWRPEAPLGLVLWALAALHLGTVAAATWWPGRLARALAVLGVASCGAAWVFGVAIGATVIEMVHTFGQLGWAIGMALLAIGWLMLLAAALVGLVAAAAVLSPLLHMEADSFPISSYPMFARPRGQPTLYALRGRRSDGSELRLPAEVVGSSEVLQTKVLIQRSVEQGPEAMRDLCKAVAARIAESPARYGAPAAVEIVRRRFDPIGYFEKGPEPIEQERLMQCEVPRRAAAARARSGKR